MVRSLCSKGLLVLCGLTLALPTQAATVTAHVTTQNGDPAENAVVSVVRTGEAPASAKPGAKAIMVQEDRQFSPMVLPVQLGTTVEFPNHDPFRHQVYSFSAAKTFELKLYGGDQTQRVVFDKEGVVVLGCNIHDNMLAYIYVVGTPYFGVSGADGKVSVPGQIPAGSYTVKVWHAGEKAGETVSKDITLAADSAATVDLKIELKRDRRQKKPAAAGDKEY